MTDIEYDAYYDRKKKEIIDKLIGADAKVPIGDNGHTKVSKRIKRTSDPNYMHATECARKWLAGFNASMRVNGGKHVTYVDSEPNPEVPPPVK